MINPQHACAVEVILLSFICLFFLTSFNSPGLTWRDVQYLIVYTSKSDGFRTYRDKWRTNGAGLRYNHQFGFGIADAEAMVTRAKYWVNVPPQYEETVEPQHTNG